VELYLIRHADAAPLGEGGITVDADRPLTAEGQTQARLLATGLQQRGIQPGVIVTSPLLRARQTAEGMVRAWSQPAPDVRAYEELAPGGKRRRLIRSIRDFGSEKVALVGHQPDLGKFAAWLIGSKKAQIDIAKAGVVCIVFNGRPGKGEGRLVWQVTPEWLGE
jgi:phosphohistidine phosphatase